jgi:hypothetical protein
MLWQALVKYDYGTTQDDMDWVSASIEINGAILRVSRCIGPAMPTLVRPPLDRIKRDLQRELLHQIDRNYFGDHRS